MWYSLHWYPMSVNLDEISKVMIIDNESCAFCNGKENINIYFLLLSCQVCLESFD
jgi:hypothetical protein